MTSEHCNIIVQPVFWAGNNDKGAILILQDDEGNKLQSSLTNNKVMNLVDKLLESTEIESYEYKKK